MLYEVFVVSVCGMNGFQPVLITTHYRDAEKRLGHELNTIGSKAKLESWEIEKPEADRIKPQC